MPLWNAVVLAGDRGPNDPVAQAAGVHCKAAANFQGISLLERVVSALEASKSVESIIIVGPDEDSLKTNTRLASYLNKSNIIYLPPEDGPSSSALKGVRHIKYHPTLLLTCDLPLVSAELIDDYCQSLQAANSDFVVTAVNYPCIAKFMPGVNKTIYQFKGQQVCFANLFAVLSERGQRVIEYWQDIESSRKKPLEIITKIDWLSLLGYKLKLLTLEGVAKKLSRKLDASITVQLSDVANLALDVDSADDYRLFLEYFKHFD